MISAAIRVVYRVENERGDGPYSCGVSNLATNEMSDLDEDGNPRWPGPFSDFRWLDELDATSDVSRIVVERMHFGFPSPEAAERWFGKVGLAKLAQHGFTLRAYRVPHALVSDSGRQVMFDRHRATLIREGVAPDFTAPTPTYDVVASL